MIRPFTCLSVLLAAGSGLYLYSEKHRTTLLDDRIRLVVEDTHRIEDRTSMLRAEWALLNQPDRLQTLATKFLPGLAPIAPTQFVQIAELDRHLPPVGAPPAPSAPGQAVPTLPAAAPPPVALASAIITIPAQTPVVAMSKAAGTATQVASAATPRPTAAPHAQPALHLAALHLAGLPHRPAAAQHRRVMVASATPHLAPAAREVDPVHDAAYVPRVASAMSWRPAAPVATAAAYTGSALGMAGGAAIAPPMPVAR